jgi:hypothetical protein
LCKPWVLQRWDLYVEVILFVMCKKNHTIWYVYINLTQTMLGSCFTSCLLEGVCLIYINCACLCIVVSNIHCVVFLLILFRLMYSKLSVSPDCHFWIALWYSLTFRYRRLTFPICMWTPTFSVKHKNLSFFDLRIAITLWYISPLTYVWSSLLVKNKYVVHYLQPSDK